VLIADEITSALDVSVQGAVLNLVREIQRRLGISMLFISHNLAVVRYVCDTVAVMYCGRIVEVAPTDALIRAPQHPYTQALIASVPSLRGGLDGAAVVDTDPPDPHDPPPGCRFHPRCPLAVDICRESDPSADAGGRTHQVACFFPGEAPAAAHRSR